MTSGVGPEGHPNFTPVEPGFGYRVDFRHQTPDQLISFINETLLPLENEKYTGGNTAEHKLLFLVAGDENDVSVARTHDGRLVYTEQPEHPKAPEIAEFTAAVSDYFEREKNMPHVLSESADIFFNVMTLVELDPERSETYRQWFGRLHVSMGISKRDALLLAAVKYNRRLNVGKDVEAEERLIAMLITPDLMNNTPAITIPTDEGLGNAYRTANALGSIVLRPRLEEIRKTPPFVEPEEHQGRLIN